MEFDLSMLKEEVIEKATAVDPITHTSEDVKEESVEEKAEIKEEVKEEIQDEIQNENSPEVIEKVLEDIVNIEKETNPEVNTTEEGKDSEDIPAESVYSTLAEFLKERGILSASDGIKDEDSFVDAIKNTIEETKYEGLTKAQKAYQESIEAGIDEKNAALIATTLKDVGNVTEDLLKENEELSIALITEDLKSQGWAHERIAKQINRIRESKELVDEGLISRDNIEQRTNKFIEDNKTQAKEAEEFRVNQEKEQMQKLKDTIYKYEKALGSVKVDDNLRNSVYSAMTTPVDYLKDGTPINAMTKDRLNDPIEFDNRLYYAYTLTNGFKDISRLQRRAENAAAKKLKAAVQGLNVEMGSKGSGMVPTSKNMPDIIDL